MKTQNEGGDFSCDKVQYTFYQGQVPFPWSQNTDILALCLFLIILNCDPKKNRENHGMTDMIMTKT